MRIEGKEYRTIWFENNVVKIIDQTKLPHEFIIKDLKTVKDSINAIEVMEVRGAPLIGCLLYTSPSPRDRTRSRMPSSA